MARTLSICGPVLCIALSIAGTAWADKPRIAVLGLEVPIGPGGASDPGAQLVAREITRELRQRVQSPASPYETAPNSNKELVDEKLLMSCETEALDCMVVIAAGLASDVLLYGRVDKRGDSFRVSLRLLDVKRRSIQSAVDDLPVGGAVAGISRRLYRKLIGDGPGGDGTLIIKARAETRGAIRSGTVLVDDEPRAQLVGGRATVTGVTEGRHGVAVDAPGFRRFEEIVTVRSGEPVTVDALLRRQPVAAPRRAAPPAEPAQQPAPRAERSRLWLWTLAGGAALAIGGGGYAWYSNDRQQAWARRVNADINDSRCSDNDTQLLDDYGIKINLPAFRRACTWHTRTYYYGYGTAGIGLVVAITSLIMYSRDPGPAEVPASGSRSKQPDIAVVPIVTPTLAGAQLTLAW